MAEDSPPSVAARRPFDDFAGAPPTAPDDGAAAAVDDAAVAGAGLAAATTVACAAAAAAAACVAASAEGAATAPELCRRADPASALAALGEGDLGAADPGIVGSAAGSASASRSEVDGDGMEDADGARAAADVKVALLWPAAAPPGVLTLAA
jgi:hypothetical protein